MSKETKDMRSLINKVQTEINDVIHEKYGVRYVELFIIEDDFLIKQEDDSWNNYFYLKIDRASWEVKNISMGSIKYSLKEITELTQDVITILKKYSKDFDAIFGVKIETIDDFINNCQTLLESGIEKRYVLGKRVLRNWTDDSYDEYGVIFEPNAFFDLCFDDDDKKWENGKNKRFYCEFEKDTIDSAALATVLNKIVEKNRDTIEKYIKEGKDED